MDTKLCGHLLCGEEFVPFSATARSGHRRYVIHVAGGLESIASEEIAEVPDCSDVQCLLGKVLFSSTASPETLRKLRSAELLVLALLHSIVYT